MRPSDNERDVFRQKIIFRLRSTLRPETQVLRLRFEFIWWQNTRNGSPPLRMTEGEDARLERLLRKPHAHRRPEVDGYPCAVGENPTLSLARSLTLPSVGKGKDMIDFTRAFSTAWERMVIILFQPFDLGKWCVIGFSAFLAGFLSGGNGFNSSYQDNFDQQNKTSAAYNPMHQMQTGVGQFFADHTFSFLMVLGVVVFIFAIALMVLIYWLGARGQFLFLDNIVRNRAAIEWPWKTYARPANSVFFAYLIFMAVGIGIAIVLVVPAILLYLPFFPHPQWPPNGVLVALVMLALVYLAFFLVFGVVVFIFREWGIPLIFRNGLTVRAAFGESLALIRRHPGSTALFIVLRVALFIALAILSVVACCFTCCLAALPYLGTVVLLPALIYIRCFSLDCLAQFGPTYDVWTVDVRPDSVPPLFTPPPPRG